jgi:hypothetical protein
MDLKRLIIFLCLVLAQVGHSIEEYRYRLYEVFAPVRTVSTLASDDAATGFVVINAALVLFGLWCLLVPLRLGWPNARGFVWFWVILETANGIGHLALAGSHGGYFPGAATAPILLLFAVWLAVLMRRTQVNKPALRAGGQAGRPTLP